MLHLIALARFSGKEFAYHYATDDAKRFFEKKNDLANIPEPLSSLFSTHVLKTDVKSFKSVQKMDPYFELVTEINSLDDFIEKLRNASELTSVDVASYIEHTYNLGIFPLEKTLYYVYSDLLLKFNKSPFVANFVAYKKGPVDTESYSLYKSGDILYNDVEFHQKLSVLSNSNVYLKSIKDIVKTYSELFSNAWDNEEKNLTHRPGTPWSRAHLRGYYAPTIDDDIIKYHHIETV